MSLGLFGVHGLLLGATGCQDFRESQAECSVSKSFGAGVSNALLPQPPEVAQGFWAFGLTR